MNIISLYMAKNAFMNERSEIYELLHANFSESGSGRISTIREMFDAWSARENSRKNDIGLVHRAIVKRLDNGQSFSKAIAPFIPKEESLILEAGEASGRLVNALQSVQQQNKAGSEINSLVTGALAEPAMSLLSIGLTSWFCGSSLWPEMIKVVPEEFWPGWSIPLIHFEIAFATHWQILGSLVVVAWLYIYSIPRWTGHVRSIFDKIPPWSIYRDRQSASFLGVLGGLLSSGMELDSAMARIAKSCDPWLSWHINQIRKRLAVAGANPLSALNTGLFSSKIMDMIEDAARNRSFDTTLAHLGTDALPVIIRKVKTMAAVTGTFLTIATGLLFVYQVAVQQSATTTATNNFTKSQMK